MALTIPASDVKATELNAIVSNLTTLYANNPQNVSLSNQLYQAQLRLAIHLLSTGVISPVTLLAGSGVTYIGSAGETTYAASGAA